MPANEHLTMQIAAQVFGIETAENALVFFKDGTPAYITTRFDTLPNGSKLAQKDFLPLRKELLKHMKNIINMKAIIFNYLYCLSNSCQPIPLSQLNYSS
jgi:serine/threonine-protein kinase HipA